jgi:hypothetical protein
MTSVPLSEAKDITRTLRQARRDIEHSFRMSADAVTSLDEDSTLLADSYDDHKFTLKSALSSTKHWLGQLKTAEWQEKYGVLAAQIFFYASALFVVMRRVRIVALFKFFGRIYFWIVSRSAGGVDSQDKQTELIALGHVPVEEPSTISTFISTCETLTETETAETKTVEIKTNEIYEFDTTMKITNEIDILNDADADSKTDSKLKSVKSVDVVNVNVKTDGDVTVMIEESQSLKKTSSALDKFRDGTIAPDAPS